MSRTALPFTSRIVAQHAKDILIRDKARAQKLLAGLNPHGPVQFRKRGHHHGHRGSGGSAEKPPGETGTGVDVTDAGVTYTASLGVGSPPTNYTLLIDTGKSSLSDAPSCAKVLAYREF